MKNVFLFGASTTHGVGGPRGGWADKLKAGLHRDLYGEDAAGECCEVYELGVPGTNSADLLERFESEIHARLIGQTSPEDTIIVMQIGMNDSKAVGTPDGFVTTPEAFSQTANYLFDIAKKCSTHVVALGLTPVDERKVTPKINPLTGNKSYFSNDRIEAFDVAVQEVCLASGATFVPLFAAVPDTWADRYLFTDGIHPSDQGHEWIRSQVEPEVRKALGPLA